MKGTLKLISGIKIQSTKQDSARPTTAKVREAVLNILRGKIEGSHWLDLCSGSGSMGCEALQNGAKRIVAVEKDKANFEICKTNLFYISNKLKEPISNNIKVVCDDVVPFLKRGSLQKRIQFRQNQRKLEQSFDLIYFDPPYKDKIYEEVLELLLIGQWVKSTTLLICECSPKKKPLIPKGWILNNQKDYGNSCLIFLTPNLALRYSCDTGSRH